MYNHVEVNQKEIWSYSCIQKHQMKFTEIDTFKCNTNNEVNANIITKL